MSPIPEGGRHRCAQPQADPTGARCRSTEYTLSLEMSQLFVPLHNLVMATKSSRDAQCGEQNTGALAEAEGWPPEEGLLSSRHLSSHGPYRSSQAVAAEQSNSRLEMGLWH